MIEVSSLSNIVMSIQCTHRNRESRIGTDTGGVQDRAAVHAFSGGRLASTRKEARRDLRQIHARRALTIGHGDEERRQGKEEH
jgi:hypothetical protein